MTRPTIVLLPGLDGTGTLFRPILPELDMVARTMVVRYPADEPLGYGELLELVLDALPQDEPFYLLGESFSGPLAIRAAATRPQNLRGLILIATFARKPWPWVPAWIASLVRAPLFRVYPPFKALKALIGNRGNADLHGLTREALAQFHPATLARRAREVLRVNVSADLRKCAVPVLYLAGERDPLIGKHNAREISQLTAAFTLRSLPCSHLVLQSEPRAAAQAIADFMTQEQSGGHDGQ